MPESQGRITNSPLKHQGNFGLILLVVHKNNFSVIRNNAGFGVVQTQIDKPGFVTKCLYKGTCYLKT